MRLHVAFSGPKTWPTQVLITLLWYHFFAQSEHCFPQRILFHRIRKQKRRRKSKDANERQSGLWKSTGCPLCGREGGLQERRPGWGARKDSPHTIIRLVRWKYWAAILLLRSSRVSSQSKAGSNGARKGLGTLLIVHRAPLLRWLRCPHLITP